MLNNHRLIRNTTIYALGDIIPKALGFLILPVLATYLTPAQNGIAGYVTTVNTFLSIVGLLSLNTYFLVHYFRLPDEQARRGLLGNLSIFILIVNVVLALVMFGLGRWFFGALQSEIAFFPYIALGVGSAFFSSFLVMPAALYRLRENPLPLTLLNIGRSAVQVGLSVLLIVRYDMGALGVLWANFAAMAVFALIFAAITAREAVLRFSWREVRAALRFSLPLLPGSLAYALIQISDRILIERYVSLSDLGIYNMAANMALLLNIVSYGAYRAFEPHFFREFGSDGFERMFKKVRNAFLVLLLVMVLGVSLFTRELFELIANPSYGRVYFYVPLIMTGVLFSSMSMIYNTIVTARGRTKITSLITIVGGCVSVGLNILLLPILGLVAACVVSGVVFCVMLLLAIHFAALPSIDHVRPVLAIVLTALVIACGVYLLPIDGFWPRLAIKSALLVGATFAILGIMGQTPTKLFSLFKN